MEEYTASLKAMPLSQLRDVSLKEILGENFWETVKTVNVQALGQTVRELIEEKQSAQ